MFLSSDSLFSDCKEEFTAQFQKIRKDIDVTSQHTFVFRRFGCSGFFSSPPLCLRVPKRTLQRKWDRDVLFVLKLSTLDCVFICGV